ncbi:hypothetical protein MMR14E_10055 [Methylobacterium mesophilicum]
MSESRSAAHRSSADAAIKSDLAKVDAHTITPEEYDEVPELTDAMLARADFYVGDRFLPRGPTGRSDEVVAIHLLPEIVSYFRAQGPGWQARINTVLMEAIERERATQSR